MLDDDDHDIHYSYDTTPTVMVLGVGDIFLNMCTMIQNILIICQGYLGIKAVAKDKIDAINLLIRNALILTLIHLALSAIQILIAAVSISDNEDK